MGSLKRKLALAGEEEDGEIIGMDGDDKNPPNDHPRTTTTMTIRNGGGGVAAAAGSSGMVSTKGQKQGQLKVDEDTDYKNESYSDEDEDGSSDSYDDGDSDTVDPFPFLLRCPNEGCIPTDEQQVLWWQSTSPYLPLHVEQSLVDTLVRWKETERGMMKDQPPWRLEQIQKLCKRKHVPLPLALSLRRHHIKNYNPHARMPALRLGRETDVRQSAHVFEQCVEEYLRRQQVEFWTEQEQRQHNHPYLKASASKNHRPPSPDFVLKKPIVIKRFYYSHNNKKKQQRNNKNNNNNNKNANNKKKKQRIISNEQYNIGWIEVKMFYGASTIPPDDNRSAVGCILHTARKYVRSYGPGAMIFMYGCGDQLANELAKLNVIALDCNCCGGHGSRGGGCHGHGNKSSSNNTETDTVLLARVHEHQRTWCANPNGQILP